MIEVFPIIVPTVDHLKLVRTAVKLIGGPVGRDLDDKGVDTTKLPGLVELIAELGGGAENHLSFTFMVAAPIDILYDMMHSSDLKVTIIKGESGALFSGSLRVWKQAIRHYCQPHTLTDTRYVYNQIAWYLEQIGFHFPNKTSLLDGTWRL